MTKSTPRTIVQIAMFFIVAAGAFFRNIQHTFGGLFPELQGFCPIGAVQTLFRAASDPAFLLRPDRSNLWVISGVLLITILFGAVFCSYLCPLGSLQEWIGKIGKKLLGRRYNRPVPKILDRVLGSLRYVFIILIGLGVFGVIVFQTDLINLSYALVHLWSTVVPISAVLVLLAVILASLIYERPWCRWLCPYGVILGTIGKISLFKIRRSKELCITCGACDRVCPARIPVSQALNINDTRCSRCSRCISACPVKGALVSHKAARGTAAAVLVVIIFFAPLASARAAGRYNPSGNVQEVQSVFDPDSISPMTTLGDLARSMGIGYHELTELLGLPDDYDGETMLFDIEEDLEFEHITVGYIREQVQSYISSKD